MTNETILTDDQVRNIIEDVAWPNEEVFKFTVEVARAIEQAVLQSPEIQLMRKDALFGRVAMRFVDRAGDYCKEDPAEKICDEFNAAIHAAMEQQDMTNKNSGGPAFPFEDVQQRNGAVVSKWSNYPGISIRDYFAAMAIQGIVPKMGEYATCEDIAEDAFKVADAMLKERQK